MPPRLKRAPPYDDDPGCKYIVIENPWPGNATGKNRNELYFNYLCAWVRFMLNKEDEPDCVFTMNTREEVIVQLPKDVDIVPIVGAHPWPRFLGPRVTARDRDRVSYVFAYDYRMRGEPASHNWLENYPTASGEDPPPHIRFPIVFPYPRASWAAPRGRKSADLALPLPPMRQPTPPPQPTLEEEGDSAVVPPAGPSGAQGANERVAETKGVLDALLRESIVDIKPHISLEPAGVKQDPDGVRVKTEAVKREERHEPSEAFSARIQQLQRDRAAALTAPQPSTEASSGDPRSGVKREEAGMKLPPPVESTAIVPQADPRVKEEPGAIPPPSDKFIAMFQSIRGTPRVKEEPQANSPPSEQFTATFSSARGTPREPSAPATQGSQTTRGLSGSHDPSMGIPPASETAAKARGASHAAPLTGSKRVKEEEDGHGRAKRLRG